MSAGSPPFRPAPAVSRRVRRRTGRASRCAPGLRAPWLPEGATAWKPSGSSACPLVRAPSPCPLVRALQSGPPVRPSSQALQSCLCHAKRASGATGHVTATVRLVTAAGRRLVPNRSWHAVRTTGECDDPRGPATTGCRAIDCRRGNRSAHAASCCRVKMTFRTSMMFRA